jgi:hypothetical protein
MLVDAPARQNASAMYTSASPRSNSGGGGLNGSLVLSRFSSWDRGKRVEGARSLFEGFWPVFAPFRFLEAQAAAPAISCGLENRYDSMAF